MPRGVLKDFGAGYPRLRLAKSGFDASDLNLHPNSVIFDSESVGGLPVFTHGVYALTGNRSYGAGNVVSWPSLGYVPFGRVELYDNLDGGQAVAISGGSGVIFDAFFAADGLKLDASGLPYPMKVRYVVFRVQVG